MRLGLLSKNPTEYLDTIEKPFKMLNTRWFSHIPYLNYMLPSIIYDHLITFVIIKSKQRQLCMKTYG